MKRSELKEVIRQVIEEGTGVELYSKGADRVVSQAEQLSKAATKLASKTRGEATLRARKMALTEIKKWLKSIEGEIEMLEKDIDNIEF
jgi:hypothetical protein